MSDPQQPAAAPVPARYPYPVPQTQVLPLCGVYLIVRAQQGEDEAQRRAWLAIDAYRNALRHVDTMLCSHGDRRVLVQTLSDAAADLELIAALLGREAGHLRAPLAHVDAIPPLVKQAADAAARELDLALKVDRIRRRTLTAAGAQTPATITPAPPITPIGYLRVRDIRAAFPDLTDAQVENVRKRLARWRETGDHEDQCRHQVDDGTGRFEWWYPAAVVATAVRGVRERPRASVKPR